MVTCFFPNNVKVHVTAIDGAAERLALHGGALFTPPVGRGRFKAMGEVQEVLRFPLDDLHMLPGEGAPAYCRVRRAQGQDQTYAHHAHTGSLYIQH